MRLVCVGLVLAFGCGSDPGGGGGDDVVPIDAPMVDPCVQDPANCPQDNGTFVSTSKGIDSNPGTKQMPFKTIAAGIAHAKMLGGAQPVYVAQGMYPEKVMLSEGIALNGGYECNGNACSWTRDLVMFETTIVNQDFEGVLAGSAITPATLIGGFTILGKDGMPTAAPGSAGLTIANGSPTIRGNKIRGGAVQGSVVSAADRSIGIAMRGTGTGVALIENNDIMSGQASGISAAMTIERLGGVDALSKINANVLRGGQGRRSIGVWAVGSASGTLVSGNDITAGSSMNGASNAIEASSSLSIDRNRINVDSAIVGTCSQTTQWCAGIASFSATLVITNNIVFGPKGQRTAGVFMMEAETPGGLVLLNSNYLNGGGIGGNPTGTRPESAAVVVSIGQCNTCGLNGVIGRVRNNILDGGINMNRYGVREDPAANKTTRVEVLQANDFWFAAMLPNRSDALYRQIGAGGTPIDTKSVFLLNQNTTPPTSQNINDDPLIDPTWHLVQQSPCVNAGVATEAPALDFEEESRPSSGVVDIGHDERH
jgi:hypothetical protein